MFILSKKILKPKNLRNITMCVINPNKIYHNMTNDVETYEEYKYVDDVDILNEELVCNENWTTKNGLHFTEIGNIFKYLNLGTFVREVRVLNSGFKLAKDCYKSNMILLGKKYELSKSDTFRMLLSKGANITEDNNYALRWSALNSYYDIAKLLMEKGANAKNNSSLICASISGSTNIAKLLLDHGAMVDFENNRAIIVAASYGFSDLAGLLLENGADIHINNDAPLRYAAHNGHFEVVKLLLNSGANINADNGAPTRYANENNYPQIVKLLSKH